MFDVLSLPGAWAFSHPISGALGLLFALILVIVTVVLIPYLRNWRELFHRRTVQSFIRGGLHYVFGKRGQRRVHGWRMFYRLRMEVMLRSRAGAKGISRFSAAKVWVDSEAFPRVKKLIRRARHTVAIQMFIWKDDRLGREIAGALCDAADRGVHVEISKEATGDMFEFRQDFLGTRSDADGIWKRFWSHRNIRVLHENRYDHAKVFIIDERILLLTGMNIGDEYHEEWHDYLVELRGRPFVEHYLSDGDMPGAARGARLVMNTGHRKEIRPAVMHLLASAEKSIVIEHCYLSDPAVLRVLQQRSRDDIQIVVIVPRATDFHHYANMQSITDLLAGGNPRRMEIFLYPKMFHAKIILVDRERAFVGSANLMTTSLDDMGEVNVLLEGRTSKAIRKLRDILREDILISIPVSRPPRFQWIWKWLTWLKL